MFAAAVGACGVGSMTSITSYIRIVSGSFGDMSAFWTVLARLFTNQFDESQLCLAALSSHLAIILNATDVPEVVADRGRPLFERMETARSKDDSRDSILASGWLLDALSPAGPRQSEDAALRIGKWIQQLDIDQILESISNGQLVLGVSADDPDQHRSATRTLLRHCDSGVQSHEIRVRR